MSYFPYDPDEWEIFSESRPCGSCGGDMRKCNGACTGSASFSTRRRPQADVDRIKAEKRRAHEDAVLAEADKIRATRRADTDPAREASPQGDGE